MAIKAYGRMVFWEGASMWVLGTRPGEGPFPKTAPHSHHAMQVTVSLRGAFSLESREQRLVGGAVAVAPDAAHTFGVLDAGSAVAHLFVDPHGHPGRELQRLFAKAPLVALPTPADLPARLLAALESPRRTDKALVELGRALVTHLAPGTERDERPEVRVRKMIAYASTRLDAPVSLVDAAKQVKLSTGRARHLFVEQTGMPFRTYLLWLRLMRATELFSSGSSLTSAAHGAGFSDSSHLSRTFRRMFGISADSLRV